MIVPIIYCYRTNHSNVVVQNNNSFVMFIGVLIRNLDSGGIACLYPLISGVTAWKIQIPWTSRGWYIWKLLHSNVLYL